MPDVDREMLPLLDVRDVKRKAYVVVSADRGLAGAFNTNLLKIAQKEIDEFGKENVDLFCIGKNLVIISSVATITLLKVMWNSGQK